MANKPHSSAQAFWTILDIAETLDVSKRTVQRWIASGDLVPHRFGRSVRIADGDLRTFLAQRRDV
ncbi:MAG: helix-turn-helix domain-containing protein [Proteobacteria bacterium]|nr:helix-turn-helix domain-containing protein [Pseudomonadota bacterium]